MIRKKQDQKLFVKIEYPIEFRKDLLESSRTTINLLQSIDKINRIRIEKIEKILKLNKQSRELKKITLYLKSKLPKSDPLLISEASLIKTELTKINSRTIENINSHDHVKKLDEQLRSIEQKINKLS